MTLPYEDRDPIADAATIKRLYAMVDQYDDEVTRLRAENAKLKEELQAMHRAVARFTVNA